MKKSMTVLIAVIALIAGGAALRETFHKQMHKINVKSRDVVTVTLDPKTGVKLPIDKYPSLNKLKAFKLLNGEGKSLMIVIKTEPARADILGMIEDESALEKNQARKNFFARFRKGFIHHRDRNQGLHAIYAGISDGQYKLLNLRVPAVNAETGLVDEQAIIVATPTGNLQVFQDSEVKGEKAVFEINTSKLFKDPTDMSI